MKTNRAWIGIAVAAFVLTACSSSSSQSSGDAGSGGACCALSNGTVLAASECNPQATAVDVKPGEWAGENGPGDPSCTIDPNYPCYGPNAADGGLGAPMACPCYTVSTSNMRLDGTMKACR